MKQSTVALVFTMAVVLAAAVAGTAQAPPAAAPPSSLPPAYTIGAGDVLRIIVWKEPDLTLDVTVRVDGMITVPLLGDVQAAGRSPARVGESLAQGLEKFVEMPRVAVAVAQASSARFYVVGQVVKPGEFPLSSNTTVLHGLALAGGLKEFAKPENIVIVRQDQTVVQVNYKRIAEGKDVSQNVALGRGDTIVVP